MPMIDGKHFVWRPQPSLPYAERNFNHLRVLQERKDERGWLHAYLDMEVKLTGYQTQEIGPKQVKIIPEMKLILPEGKSVSEEMKKRLIDEAARALLCWIKTDARDVIKDECRMVEENGQPVILVKIK